MVKRIASVGLAGLVVLLLLSACAAPKAAPAPAPEKPAATPAPAAPKPALSREQQLVEAAKAAGEKEVVLWSLSWYQGPVEKAFEAKYPFLKLKAVDMSAELEPRLTEEYKAGKYSPDVIQLPVYRAIRVRGAGILQEFPFSNWPNSWPGQPQHNFWRNNLASSYPSMYNTQLVSPSDVPRKWEDLADPKWRGRAIISTSAGSWIIAFAYELGDLTKEGVKWDRTLTFWKKVVEATRPRIGTGFKSPLDSVIVGDAVIALNGSATIGLYNIRLGAPIDFAPYPKIYADPLSIALPKNPPHPNAAQLLIDFLTSEEGNLIHANTAPTLTQHPEAARKALSNQYFARKGTQLAYVPMELTPEALFPQADDLWIREIIGRR
ncbi:MAG: hypothetical protein HW414_1812 [Dehalococcoidia bacterium]|nr:hypothetical protein [Dehalococcoidia bacterium]